MGGARNELTNNADGKEQPQPCGVTVQLLRIALMLISLNLLAAYLLFYSGPVETGKADRLSLTTKHPPYTQSESGTGSTRPVK